MQCHESQEALAAFGNLEPPVSKGDKGAAEQMQDERHPLSLFDESVNKVCEHGRLPLGRACSQL